MALHIGSNSTSNRLAKKQAQQKAHRLTQPCRIEPLECRQMLTLAIDLRLSDGSKSINVTKAGQQFDLQVWANVTGSDSNTHNDGLNAIMGSFTSPNVAGGSASVNLSAEPLSPFTGTASDPGAQADLDGDGDLDVGSNNPALPDGYFIARYSPTPSKLYITTPAQIGTLSVSVDHLLAGAETDVTFAVRQNALGGWWVEDGNTAALKDPTTGQITVSPFRILRSDATTPTAAIGSLPVVVNGAATTDFTVTYNDDLGISRSSLGDADVLVSDPGGHNLPVVLLSADHAGDAKQITATYRISAPGGAWDGTKNGTYQITMAASQVADTSANFVLSAPLASFTVDLPPVQDAPAASIEPGPAVPDGAPSYDVTIDYSSATAISRASLGNDNLVITDPNGKLLKAYLISADQSADAPLIRATYRIYAPGGMWDATRNGLYRVAIAPNQVSDTSGRFVPAETLDGFVVRVGNAVLSSKGILRVIGTEANDKIYLSAKNGKVGVTVNALKYSFSTTAVKKVQVYAMSGNDFVWVGRGMIGSLIDGGAGRDTLWGGDGNDAFYVRDRVLDIIDGGKGTNSARVDKVDKLSHIQKLLR